MKKITKHFLYGKVSFISNKSSNKEEAFTKDFLGRKTLFFKIKTPTGNFIQTHFCLTKNEKIMEKLEEGMTVALSQLRPFRNQFDTTHYVMEVFEVIILDDHFRPLQIIESDFEYKIKLHKDMQKAKSDELKKMLN